MVGRKRRGEGLMEYRVRLIISVRRTAPPGGRCGGGIASNNDESFSAICAFHRLTAGDLNG